MSEVDRTTFIVHTKEENVTAVLRRLGYHSSDLQLVRVKPEELGGDWRIEFSHPSYRIGDVLKDLNKAGYFEITANVKGEFKYTDVKNEGS